MSTHVAVERSGTGAARSMLAVDFSRLLDALTERGYRLVGPRLESGAIGFDEIQGVGDLPRGWRDEQAPGSTRLRRRSDEAFFGFASTTQSFKRFFHAPRETLLRVRRHKQGFDVGTNLPAARPIALIGLRGCDLRALEVLDRVMLGGAFPDEHYRARREQTAIVAVNCTTPAATCFCTSMGTGPRAGGGFDLSLTEIVEPGPHRFVAVAASALGEALLAAVTATPASDVDLARETESLDAARGAIQRHVDTDGLAKRLADHPDDPAWDEVASRCLSCTNCTMVCPTCFCSTMVDETALGSDEALRVRHWDSCFTASHSYLHGGAVRTSVRSRYRQWLTHKLSTWFDQFGTSGCTGCGRCISACPAGIDITRELARIGVPSSEGAQP